MNEHAPLHTAGGQPTLSKHRVEALQDGVYAIAITLLVLELKLPDHHGLHSQADLLRALVDLMPRLGAWLISFFVLAIFWASGHRAMHWLKVVDSKLVWINIVTLLFASFMPFASGLIGEFPQFFVSQAVYAATMGALGLCALWQLRYLTAHPELCHQPMPELLRKAAQLRCTGVVATAALAALIACWQPVFAPTAFMLMWVFGALSRRMMKQGHVAAA
ncbi:DUF1211 domain-containing protein [Pelomonas sp. V22]|uniref:TMEM175 family protein n=1 Tax=Pelomonas sp. V22 TaxID=2822139 RepID=UPI0024A85FDA|nr:TMEM175 family protein [Pelomonas sp. V22]MDI4635552.1 DUF1211 domain-containing protein [Pelomonas sp. V22]